METIRVNNTLKLVKLKCKNISLKGKASKIKLERAWTTLTKQLRWYEKFRLL